MINIDSSCKCNDKYTFTAIVVVGRGSTRLTSLAARRLVDNSSTILQEHVVLGRSALTAMMLKEMGSMGTAAHRSANGGEEVRVGKRQYLKRSAMSGLVVEEADVMP